jgi:LysM repeat protein
LKALVIIVLALAIFGGAYYAAYVLYLHPQEQLRAEQSQPPPPPPPDPALPDFDKALEIQNSGDTLAALAKWRDFVDRWPQSTKIDEAKEYLGRINMALYLSPVQTPDKTVYIVKQGDVITRVAAKFKSTPEAVIKANHLTGSMLRIGQKLMVPPTDFSLVIDRQRQKVVLLQADKFFKQYSILIMPKGHAPKAGEKKPAKPPKITGRVTEKMAWRGANRITFTDKQYNEATHWIMISPGGHNLYTEAAAAPDGTTPQKPPGGGYGLAPESMQELAALVRKNDPVTIE